MTDARKIRERYEREVNEDALPGTAEAEILTTVPALCNALEAAEGEGMLKALKAVRDEAERYGSTSWLLRRETMIAVWDAIEKAEGCEARRAGGEGRSA